MNGGDNEPDNPDLPLPGYRYGRGTVVRCFTTSAIPQTDGLQFEILSCLDRVAWVAEREKIVRLIVAAVH